MKYLWVVFIGVFFVACSQKEVKIQKKIKEPKTEKKIYTKDINTTYVKQRCEDTPVYDLTYIPQNIEYYTKKISNQKSLYKIQKRYEKYYFNVWNTSKPRESLQSVLWPFQTYKVKGSFGENLQPINKDFFANMYKLSNFKDYGSLNKKAITLRSTNIRSFPTSKPLLKDPSLAGEGFPFDYIQNSSVHANKPIFVSHFSKNKKWVYVFSSFASGWIKANDMVFLDDKNTAIWQEAQQIYLTKENIAILDNDGNYMFDSKVGMMLPLVSEDKNHYIVLAVSSFKANQPLYQKVKISKEIAHKGVMYFTRNNLNNIIKEVSKSNYGWGGGYNQRDCSSTLRDIFAPFGIWLPRNSFQQSKVGEIIDLENMSDEQKVATIKDKAIPFQTLLYKKGHIVLYVGKFNGNIVILHNTWGIKLMENGVEKRKIIGKTILSSLKLGDKQMYYDKDSEILKNIKSMNIITR